eukprot:g15999.t1
MVGLLCSCGLRTAILAGFQEFVPASGRSFRGKSLGSAEDQSSAEESEDFRTSRHQITPAISFSPKNSTSTLEALEMLSDSSFLSPSDHRIPQTEEKTKIEMRQSFAQRRVALGLGLGLKKTKIKPLTITVEKYGVTGKLDGHEHHTLITDIVPKEKLKKFMGHQGDLVDNEVTPNGGPHRPVWKWIFGGGGDGGGNCKMWDPKYDRENPGGVCYDRKLFLGQHDPEKQVLQGGAAAWVYHLKQDVGQLDAHFANVVHAASPEWKKQVQKGKEIEDELANMYTNIFQRVTGEDWKNGKIRMIWLNHHEDHITELRLMPIGNTDVPDRYN